MTKLSMQDISYGISKPSDLYGKLKRDAMKLTEAPHPYDIFDFVVTAAVLNEWVLKSYASHPFVAALADAQNAKNYSSLPMEFAEWIAHVRIPPLEGPNARMHVFAALSICWHTANASKHYHWTNTSKVSAIEPKPQIKDFYQYFFTSTEPGIYIEYDGVYYTLEQIKEVLLAFYSSLLHVVAPHE